MFECYSNSRNYAKSHPDLCILAVNTFVQDSEDTNPLIRALAIRTMGCVRVEKMINFLSEPLRKCLKDESPYVRKTAVIGVAKLYDLNAETCIENGFIETLQEMLSDPNAMVVSNVVNALAEIQRSQPFEAPVFKVDSVVASKLLSALNESSEWGRVALLNELALYKPVEQSEAEHISERIIPQLQHANASVVMAAIKVVMMNIDVLKPEVQKQTLAKIGPPLVSLLSSPPEVQYVALRNTSLILQKNPGLLSKEIRFFFCKYNDPPYVKLEKLDVMVRLANSDNIELLLMELKEYASEVDIVFARTVVRSIGRLAINVESAVDSCVNTLMDLVASKVPYVVQESAIAFRDILRTYGRTKQIDVKTILPALVENQDNIDDSEARAALIYMIGEYPAAINEPAELISSFIAGFKDEPNQVQLQLLTATVKLFLRKPAQLQDLVQRVLQDVTSESDNPDIRDRAYVYWRLLSSNPQISKV